MTQNMHSLVLPNLEQANGDRWAYNNGFCASPNDGGSSFNVRLSNNGNASQTHLAMKLEDNARMDEIHASMNGAPPIHPDSVLEDTDPLWWPAEELRARYLAMTSVDEETVAGDHPADSGQTFIATQGSRGFVIYEEPDGP